MSAVQAVTPASVFTNSLYTSMAIGMQKEMNSNSQQIKENFPWRSATGFHKNANAPSFYFLSAPTKWQLYKTARFTAIGNRLVYGTNEDAWNNNFELKFDDLSKEESKEKNKELEEHLQSVLFYQEFQKATAFDDEQGESLFFIHRKYQEYEDLKFPASEFEEVLRCEAINFIDYSYGREGKHGEADEYRICFYTEQNSKQTFHSHISHAVRVRARNIDYDQYAGQSVIKACFSDIQIHLNITRSAGDAAFRWALGMLAMKTKGINNAEDVAKVKAIIGNPTSQSWFMYPEDKITEIKALGLQGSMMDLQSLADLCITNICIQQKIPKAVFIGEAVGVIQGSRVYERSYYAKLDSKHSSWDRFIREYFSKDPKVRQILGEIKYKIDWGLRQVMTENEKAELDSLYYANAEAISGFSTFAEVRQEARKPKWSEVYKGFEKLHKELFGFSPEELEMLPMTLVQSIMSPMPTSDDEPQDDKDSDNQTLPDERDEPDNVPDDEKIEKAKKLKKAKKKVSEAIITFKDLCPSMEVFSKGIGVGGNTGYKVLYKHQQLLEALGVN